MRESIIRLLSGMVYIILLLTATLYSQKTFLILFGTFLLLATIEFCNLVQLNKVFPLILAIVFYLYFAFISLSNSSKIFLLLGTLFMALKLLYELVNQVPFKLDKNSKYVYLIGYIILPFIIITLIPIYNKTFQPSIIISIFILIWTNDTFAYIIGKSMGKHKLFESISPKKTIEGFVGGLLFTVIAGVLIARFYFNLPLIYWIVIALMVSIFGTIGDLVESKFKRKAAVKDSGTIMPGHGGVLDRLDSVIFVAPFIYLFLQLIQIV